MTKTSSTSVDLAVFIGRFQPFTLAHLYVIREALKNAKYVCVCIGSSDEPRRFDYIPFNFKERERMIMESLTPSERERVYCYPLLDYLYNMNKWVEGVQIGAIAAANWFNLNQPKIKLIGHSKDRSSFYLKKFPQWGSGIEVPNYKDISATPFRDEYLKGTEIALENISRATDFISKSVIDFLMEFSETDDYMELVAENEFMIGYKNSWSVAPYPPKFVTVDACVDQGSNILLVKRKARPGRGMWALPGGHLEDDEFIVDGIIRELIEETGIKVPEKILRANMHDPKVFDHPKRSSRGRTITHAALIKLEPEAPKGETDLNKIAQSLALPKVKGQDDAELAKFFPKTEIRRDMMFEDHWHIIDNLINI